MIAAVGFSERAIENAAGMSIHNLEYLELAYSPPYGAPRDVVNIAGSVGAALLRNDIRGIYPDELATWEARGAVIVDVRSADEFELGSLPGAVNIPPKACVNVSMACPGTGPSSSAVKSVRSPLRASGCSCSMATSV